MNKFSIGQTVKVNLSGGSAWHDMVGKIVEICYKQNGYLYGIKDCPYVHFYEYELELLTLRSKGHPLTKIFK